MLTIAFSFLERIDPADLQIVEAAVEGCAEMRCRIRCCQMDIKSHFGQSDSNGSRHRGFPYTTFTHQHDQAMLITGNIIDQRRK
ncbi:hypothetical protein D3C73_1320670 [compost metagenome]